MVGNVGIGGNYPISIQSMTNIPLQKVSDNVSQIINLVENGCEIVRLAVPKPSDVLFFKEVKDRLRKSKIEIPLVADVHFTPRVAYDCLKVADKVRINAGNFAESTSMSCKNDKNVILKKFSDFFQVAKQLHVPVRVGINAGSLSHRIISQFGDNVHGMWESAYECIEAAQLVDFEDIVFSFKASDVNLMVEAYRLACREMDALGVTYPIHLGVTEAGDNQYARIKSAIGIGSLLLDGIGDTIRVSLTEDPKSELSVARDILQSINFRWFGPEFIACPSCGRTSFDIQSVFSNVKSVLQNIPLKKHLKIAVMGCIVNGIGEARGSDYAVVGMPDGKVVIYFKGNSISEKIDPNIVHLVLKDIILSN